MSLKITGIDEAAKCPKCGNSPVYIIEEPIDDKTSRNIGACKRCLIAFDGDIKKVEELKDYKTIIEKVDFKDDSKIL